MYKKFIFPILFFIAITLALVFSMAYLSSINLTTADAPSNPSNPVDSPTSIDNPEGLSDIQELLVLGDSIAMGIGDSDSENLGQQYIDYMQSIRESRDWHIINLSVPGSVSDDLSELLKEDTVKNPLKSADLIFISVGGNDLKALFDASFIDVLTAYEETSFNYTRNLRDILSTIKQDNPDSRIVLLGLYNPYGASIGNQKIQLTLKWNLETQLIAEDYSHTIFIPLYDLFKNHLDRYLSIDNFHPSSEGYDAIVKRIDAVLQ